MKKTISAALLGIVLLFLLSGCNKDENKQNANNTVQNKIITKEQLNIGILNLDTLNPITTKNKMVQEATKLIYTSLVDIDSTYKPQYDLADNIKTANNIDWNISLKRNAKWSDGTEVVASDVYKAIDNVMNSDSIYSVNTSNILSMNTIDDHTINIRLAKNDCFFVNKLSFPIVKIGGDEKLIGSGPYAIENRQEKNILLSQNPYYTGKSAYKRINIILYDSQDSLLREFKNNQIDILELAANSETNNLVKVYKSDTYQYKNFSYIGFNTKNKYLQDIVLRQAIAYAINKDVLINNINNKTVSNANVPISNASYLYPKNIINISYDPNKSIDILKSSQIGYQRRKQFSLLIDGDNPIREQEAQSIKDDLNNIGVKVNIQKRSYYNYISSIKSGSYDMVLGSYNLSMYPDILFNFYSSSDNNYTFYSNPQYDLICDDAIKAQNPESDIRRLSEILLNDMPIVSLYFSNNVVLCGKDIFIYPKGNVWSNYNYIINQ